MQGQEINAIVERVVDGDTVRLFIDERSVSMRIQCLDTEESRAGSDKPVTPWGVETSGYAKRLLTPGEGVRIRLQSAAPLFDVDGGVAVDHLDNHNRLLGFLFLTKEVEDGGAPTNDFQEIMIRQGYSPYFVKYGRVPFPELNRRYGAAERIAQAGGRGLWNQMAVNGTVARDYPSLAIWWELRAQLIDVYRQVRDVGGAERILNTRLDYAELTTRAARGDTATVFMELSTFQVAGRHALVETGSRSQPFKLFIQNADSPEREPLRRLLANRYLATDEARPNRNYAYVTGVLQLWREKPELVLDDLGQLTDVPPA